MKTSLIPKEWQRCQVQLLRLRQGPPKSEGRNMECTTSDLTAWRIEAGEVDVKTTRCKFRAKAGEWLFLPNGYRQQQFSDDAQLTSLAFWAYWPNSLRPVLDLRPGLWVEHDATLDHCLSTLQERSTSEMEYEWHYQHDQSEFETVLAMEGWFRGWLSSAIRLWRRHLPNLETPRDMDPRVELAREWLVKQALNAPLDDLEAAANIAEMSLGHLNRLFIHHYHQTLNNFHEQRRLQYAEQKLSIPGSRIKTVALNLGFTDLSRFSAWFRRLEQMSPRQFQHRAINSSFKINDVHRSK